MKGGNTIRIISLVGARPQFIKEAVLHEEFQKEGIREILVHFSKYLFCSSRLAVENLKKEGIKEGVYFTGDVMYDLFLKMKPYFDYSIIDELKLKEDEYIVVTLHRDFNVDNPEK